MPQGWFSQILLSAVLLFLCISQEIVVPLTSCSFRIENSTESYPCSPPSTLANDLIKIGKIPADPYYRSNFLEYYQYEMLGAVYTGFFHLPLLCRTHRNKGKLVFEGLDTYCDVYFNGEKVLTANNMFRRYEVEVTNLALTNNLTLRFNSSVATDLRK
jgi:beta-mannosidase